MSVEFNEGNFTRPSFPTEQTPKIAGWLISKGLAKDVRSANRVQLIAAIVFFAVAAFLIF